jgi:ABC-type sugar transport system substrate-binding protein
MIRYARALMCAGPFALLLTLNVAGARAGEGWYPIEVDVWDPPFNTERKRHTETYMALDKAAGAWRICVSIPHLKDDYWLAVNFGIYDEAKRLGVVVNLYEAGGYDHLETQRRQIVECMARGADGLIVSAISADGLNDLVARYAEQGRPVIDLINGLSSPRITARVAVDFWDMGNHAARYLRNMLADSGNPARVAWFPGPEGAAWVAAGDQGFQEGIEGSAIEIIASAHGDTGSAGRPSRSGPYRGHGGHGRGRRHAAEPTGIVGSGPTARLLLQPRRAPRDTSRMDRRRTNGSAGDPGAYCPQSDRSSPGEAAVSETCGQQGQGRGPHQHDRFRQLRNPPAERVSPHLQRERVMTGAPPADASNPPRW